MFLSFKKGRTKYVNIGWQTKGIQKSSKLSQERTSYSLGTGQVSLAGGEKLRGQ